MTRKPKGAESNIEFINRVTGFINNLLEMHLGQDVLIIAHGGVIRIMQFHFSDQDFETICSRKPENGGIYEFEITKPLSLIS
jgi:broad specificity phosphatase PhoE